MRRQSYLPGWGYPPPPPPGWGYVPPPTHRPVSGLAVLVLVTILAALVAPHAKTARAALADFRRPSIDLPGLPRPAPDRAAPARPSPRAGAAVAYARGQLGKPYRWAAEGPAAFDCSGLTWASWRAAGLSIPRTAAGQLAGLPPARGPLRPGDLLIYRTNGPSRRHVAIVAGPGAMIEARGRGIPVRQVPIRRAYLGAVRPGAA
jgi:cell wall-associated NlpC family hydrolase